MDKEITLGFDDWSITEALFTWNDENNMVSVGYEMGKKKLQYLRQLIGVQYCSIFYQEIISDLRVKEIIEIIGTSVFTWFFVQKI